MVCQDCDERILVLREEQCVNKAIRQCGERLIGRSEDGERSIAVERVDKVGSANGCDERLERSGASCDFDFYVVTQTFALLDTGFRCCFSSDPTQ